MRERDHIPLRANMWQSELLHLQIVFCRWNCQQHSALCWGQRFVGVCVQKGEKHLSQGATKPGTITITASSTTFVETKLPGNLCDHCWSFFLAKGTLRSIMLVYCKTQPYIKTKSIWNSYAWWQELDEIPCNAKRAQGFWTILSANVNLKEWKKE